MFSGLGRVTSIVKKVVAVTFPIRTLNFQRDFSGPGKVRRLTFLEGVVRISGNLGNAFLICAGGISFAGRARCCLWTIQEFLVER